MDIACLIRDKREEILAIAAKNGVYHMRIFGSLARGEADEASDVDFLVKLGPECSLLDHARLINELEDLLGIKVDVVPEDALKEQIREQVFREAVAL